MVNPDPHTHQATVRSVADTIGRTLLATALDVGLTAVGNAVTRDQFPASWFKVVSDLAAEAGIEAPLHLFGMKTIISRSGDVTQSNQHSGPIKNETRQQAGA